MIGMLSMPSVELLVPKKNVSFRAAPAKEKQESKEAKTAREAEDFSALRGRTTAAGTLSQGS